MDSQNLFEKYPFLKQNLVPIALASIGLIFLGYGLISLIGSSSSNEIIFEPGPDSSLSSQSSGDDKRKEIVVDIEGAVLKPGVYRLPSNSRISDGLIAAGGLSGNADRDWLAKNLNLAVKLTDGTKIYIPQKGESFTGTTTTTGSNADRLININKASEELLDSLPGIGPVTTQKIISGRPYNSIDELLSRKIVGSKVFEEVSEKITVY